MYGVDLIEAGKRTSQPFVATRAGSSALDPKSVTFANRVDVRQMRDAPCPAYGVVYAVASKSRGWGIIASAHPQITAATAK